MVTIAGILLALTAAFFVCFPLWQKEGYYDNSEDRSEEQKAFSALTGKKEKAYRAIKELDLDYRMGKISPEDYQELNRRYKDEALEILREMDEGRGKCKRQHRQKAKGTGKKAKNGLSEWRD